MNPELSRKALRSWSQNTTETSSRAKRKAPRASTRLARSIMAIKAKITSTGIVSFVESRLSYALRLETAESDKNWKLPGQVSYYAGGKPVLKIFKGQKEFVGKAVDEMDEEFVKDLEDVIGEVWRAV